jgi:DNA-binding NarL/FixJ family response regulator
MKILMADDHGLFRDGMRYVLQQLSDGLELLESDSFQSALTLADQHPDLAMVLLDLHMPGSDGIKSVDYFHQRFPDVPVVVISGDESSANIKMAMRFGAAGYISKVSSAQLMLEALSHVLSGGVYFPGEIMPDQHGILYDKNSQFGYKLTLRQLEVLQHICAGLSNKEIAKTMNLADGTVKVHVSAVYQALQVSSRMEAVRTASYLGLTGGKYYG